MPVMPVKPAKSDLGFFSSKEINQRQNIIKKLTGPKSAPARTISTAGSKALLRAREAKKTRETTSQVGQRRMAREGSNRGETTNMLGQGASKSRTRIVTSVDSGGVTENILSFVRQGGRKGGQNRTENQPLLPKASGSGQRIERTYSQRIPDYTKGAQWLLKEPLDPLNSNP